MATVDRALVANVQTLNFRILDNGADLFQRLRAALLHTLVRVGENLDQFRNDAREAGRELLRCTVSHGAEQFDCTALGSPKIRFQAFQEAWKHDFHSVASQFAHDRSGAILGCIANFRVVVTEAQQQIR